jgi:hypothetical protein
MLLNVVNNKIKSLSIARKDLLDQIEKRKETLHDVETEIFELGLTSSLLKEIYRLASHHFPRLTGKPGLSDSDIAELEKWIGRAKSDVGLHSIINALSELKKYRSPDDIKSNFYALIQKIIIEGPYRHGK